MGLEVAPTTPSTCTSARLVGKEQFYEGKRQTDNSIVMYKCQGCIIQILSQCFRIFLGYSSLPKPIQYVNSGWKSNVEE